MFLPAIGRSGGQANRQYEIDHFHFSTFAASTNARSMVLAGRHPGQNLVAEFPQGARWETGIAESYALAPWSSIKTDGQELRLGCEAAIGL
jgi:hypothetical protein